MIDKKYLANGQTLTLKGLKKWVDKYIEYFGDRDPAILISVADKTATLNFSACTNTDDKDIYVWLMDAESYYERFQTEDK